LLLAMAHGLADDFVQLVSRVAQYPQDGIARACRDGPFGGRRQAALLKPSAEEPHGLSESILFGRETTAVDFRPQESLQIFW
jgi:hypothetical protein